MPADAVTVHGSPRTGVYLLPDNASVGTLESLLTECARISYPDLLNGADQFVGGVNRDVLTSDELKGLIAPAGKAKATVARIADILRPGKSIQVSISDNRWITTETLKLDRIRRFQSFLANLFELP